ncbi:hypothetical protein [uncultured Pontibacter sp.]|uniref:hypothetical protein n=1 Tax=uncultured Pontibacter sp. TaxID=453356 RepID=UPI00260649F9|nr:hypothetical protein [uncultured Pontibacter sp.]
MKSFRIIIFTLVVLTSCKSDDFISVTKTIEAPEQIEVNEPFEVKLILTNNTTAHLPLTLDQDITKSIHLMPHWYCGDEYLSDRTPNPKDKIHTYYSVELAPKESLTFDLMAELSVFSNGDSLRLVIDNYEKDFKLANPNCENFNLTLGGMWIPGNGPFGDSMEGYDFKTKIKIKPPAN